MEKCPECYGEGYTGHFDRECSWCKGTGRKDIHDQNKADYDRDYKIDVHGNRVCSYCGGSGSIAGENCPNCSL